MFGTLEYFRTFVAMNRIVSAAALLLSILPCSAIVPDAPAFINQHANTVQGSLPRFEASLKALENGKDTTLRILHIGDSHIQAEFVTDEVRRLLQERYGNAGRGLMPALRLAGTNQSYGYALTCDHKPDIQTRLLKTPWPAAPGITGISVICNEPATYSIKNEDQPFCSLDIFTGSGVQHRSFSQPTDTAAFNLGAGEALYGVYAVNGKPGVIYSAIGNNGACFADYNKVDRFTEQTAFFRPDLIILSMGTNEGFSKMTDEAIRYSVINLAGDLRAANPDAEMLILLPMECHINDNRFLKQLKPDYRINNRVKEARDIIKATAREEGIPVWDFFDIAGGDGASAQWIDAGLMNPRDHIHLLKSGYELQARLLFDALTN